MMNSIFIWILAFLAGVLLGGFFFGGLWWTVQKGLESQKAGLWFLGSMLVRTVVVLGGFYFVSDGHWERMVAILAGFILARIVILRLNLQSSQSKINN